MPSKNRIVAYLKNEDFELWQRALKKYGSKESELLKEVVHGWLFSIKLQLLSK